MSARGCDIQKIKLKMPIKKVSAHRNVITFYFKALGKMKFFLGGKVEALLQFWVCVMAIANWKCAYTCGLGNLLFRMSELF